MSDFKSLLEKVSTGKATVQEKLEFANLLSLQAQEEKTKHFSEKLEKIKAFIIKEGLTVDEVINSLKNPPVAIFKWEGNIIYKGVKGRAPSWTNQLKTELRQKDAEEFALNEDGKKWVHNLYNPKAK